MPEVGDGCRSTLAQRLREHQQDVARATHIREFVGGLVRRHPAEGVETMSRGDGQGLLDVINLKGDPVHADDIPLTVSRPRIVSPRSVKNVMASSRSRTAMATFAILMGMGSMLVVELETPWPLRWPYVHRESSTLPTRRHDPRRQPPTGGIH